LGERVNGKVAPEAANPAPFTPAALIVTDAVPVELKVIDWVVAVLTGTLPKLRLAVLTLNAAIPLVPTL
jgi:hypothetical protein